MERRLARRRMLAHRNGALPGALVARTFASVATSALVLAALTAAIVITTAEIPWNLADSCVTRAHRMRLKCWPGTGPEKGGKT